MQRKLIVIGMRVSYQPTDDLPEEELELRGELGTVKTLPIFCKENKTWEVDVEWDWLLAAHTSLTTIPCDTNLLAQAGASNV